MDHHQPLHRCCCLLWGRPLRTYQLLPASGLLQAKLGWLNPASIGVEQIGPVSAVMYSSPPEPCRALTALQEQPVEFKREDWGWFWLIHWACCRAGLTWIDRAIAIAIWSASSFTSFHPDSEKWRGFAVRNQQSPKLILMQNWQQQRRTHTHSREIFYGQGSSPGNSEHRRLACLGNPLSVYRKEADPPLLRRRALINKIRAWGRNVICRKWRPSRDGGKRLLRNRLCNDFSPSPSGWNQRTRSVPKNKRALKDGCCQNLFKTGWMHGNPDWANLRTKCLQTFVYLLYSFILPSLPNLRYIF